MFSDKECSGDEMCKTKKVAKFSSATVKNLLALMTSKSLEAS